MDPAATLGHEKREVHRRKLIVWNDHLDAPGHRGGDQSDTDRGGRDQRDLIRISADKVREVPSAGLTLAIPLLDPVRFPSLPAVKCTGQRINARPWR